MTSLARTLLRSTCAAALLAAACGGSSAPTGPVTWTHLTDPSPAQIVGGPWSLTQLAASNPSAKSAAPYLAAGTGVNVSWNYCSGGQQNVNSSTTPVNMQPYYFPRVYGDGKNLSGFFDWRPKDMNEMVVAASSTDGGKTWQYNSSAYRLTAACPTDTTQTNPNSTQADNGFGHPFQLTVAGVTRLYLLDRSDASVDNLGLVVTPLSSDATHPLQGLPIDTSGTATRTSGLINPDGIMGVVPGKSPVTVLYVSKIKGGDNTGTTALPTAQQCPTQPYPATGTTKAKSPNHDLVTIRIATTSDGVAFTDQGAVSGLNDPTAVDFNKIRYVAPNGTILKLNNGNYGLFFAGGNCMDADSDAFHFIGYAESADLKTWTVLNDVNSPIASIETKTFTANGTSYTIPANKPVIGTTAAWYAGRVYGPQVVRNDSTSVTLVFAGYGVQSPNSDLLNYRQIGNVTISASQALPAQQ